MKAIVWSGPGGAAALDIQEIPEPSPGHGEILVRVLGSSVNPVDAKIADGTLAELAPPPPTVLGTDVCGVVEALGDGVDDFAVGDTVYGVSGGVGGRPGAWAEVQICDARLVARAPRSVPAEDSAALALVGITAAEAMAHLRPEPGMRLLVHGGAGGVGHVAVQLAARTGAEVYATAREAHLGTVQGFGATHVVAHDTQEGARELEALAGRGFDAVLDTVGGDVLDRSFGQTRAYGTLVTTLALSTHDLSVAHARALSLHVVYMLLPILEDVGVARHRPILESLSRRVDAGELRLHVNQRFGFRRVAEALDALARPGGVGKLVLHNDLAERDA